MPNPAAELLTLAESLIEVADGTAAVAADQEWGSDVLSPESVSEMVDRGRLFEAAE